MRSPVKQSIPITAAVVLGAAALALSGCSGSPSGGASTPAADPAKLVLAMEPAEQKADLQTEGQTIADALTKSLGIPVEVTVPDDYAALVTALGTGQADIAFAAPASLVQAVDQGVATPLLQVTRGGSRSYVAQWFTTDPGTYCDTPVVTKSETLSDGSSHDFKFCNGVDTAQYGDSVGTDDLKKLTKDTPISFVDEGSASGYEFPVVQLENLGVISSPEDLTAITFAGGHPQSVIAVADGTADVGTSYDDARADAIAEDPNVDKLMVFAWSSPIPNDGVVAASDLSADLQARIKTAVQGLLDDAGAKDALNKAYQIDGFQDPDMDALDVVRQVNQQFQ